MPGRRLCRRELAATGRNAGGGARRRRARAAPPGARACCSPCARQSRTAGTPLVQLRTGGRACTLARMEAAEIDLTLASPPTMASASTSSLGRRLPSTSTFTGFRRRPSTARRIASMVAWKMLCVSISSTVAWATEQHSAFSRILSYRRRAAAGQHLGIGQAADALAVVEDDRGGHHRAGQRAAAGLVDAGQQARAGSQSSGFCRTC
jgi:hypothetical protein